MAGLGSGCGIIESPSNPIAQGRNEDGERKKISEYEQFREERIKENLERMQKLGIFDLSRKVKALKPTPKTRKTPSARSTPPNSTPLPPPAPVRRSSRLQSVTPVSYSEAYLTKKDKYSERLDDILREEGSKPEVYTEEHEKLLGSTEMGWTLFVDGYGKDGKRIYDPVKGKTCHQCRQKTLGHRTKCSKCNMVQGQFCGDCLYMRYGENVLEANQNPNWICPVCRGICNCSLCRQAKGWPPTGPLYRRISGLGYKSVAHYLIQTRCLKTETEADPNSKVPVSAKRSLPFTLVEDTSTEMVLMDCSTNPQLFKNPECEGDKPENLPRDDKQEGDHKQEVETDYMETEQGDYKFDMEMKLECPTELNAETSLCLGPRGKETDILVDIKHDSSNVIEEENIILNKAELPTSVHDQKGTCQMELEINENNHKLNGKKEDKTSYLDNSEIECILAPESGLKSNKKHFQNIEPSADSIAGRLRTTHNRNNQQEEHRLTEVENGNKEDKTSSADNTEIECILAPESITKSNKKRVRNIGPSDDSIAGRLRMRRNRDNQQEEHELTGAENGTLGVKQEFNGISPEQIAKSAVSNSNSSSGATITDNIPGRLGKRRAEDRELQVNKFSSSSKAEAASDISSPAATITSSKPKNKRIHSTEQSPDSIAGRLRQRHVQAQGL